MYVQLLPNKRDILCNQVVSRDRIKSYLQGDFSNIVSFVSCSLVA